MVIVLDVSFSFHYYSLARLKRLRLIVRSGVSIEKAKKKDRPFRSNRVGFFCSIRIIVNSWMSLILCHSQSVTELMDTVVFQKNLVQDWAPKDSSIPMKKFIFIHYPLHNLTDHRYWLFLFCFSPPNTSFFVRPNALTTTLCSLLNIFRFYVGLRVRMIYNFPKMKTFCG